MWAAYLKIQVGNLVEETVYHMDRIYRYRDMYNQIYDILRDVGLDRLYHPRKHLVRFYFYYQNAWIYVDDMSKFILNKDLICVKIFNRPVNYSLVDSLDGRVIKEDVNLNIIREYYKKISPRLTRALIIKKDRQILDVLDLPIYHYNACVNRLVHEWRY